MSIRYVGAILVILACGGCGFSMAAAFRREEQLLRQLSDILQFLYCELQFRLTPLPELCAEVSGKGRGTMYAFFGCLGELLRQNRYPLVKDCVYAAMEQKELSPEIRGLLVALGQTLGQFDLSGQLSGLEAVRHRCGQALESLCRGREDRIRSYQTLGLCAGSALAILFV